jgi:hypothetical protein
MRNISRKPKPRIRATAENNITPRARGYISDIPDATANAIPVKKTKNAINVAKLSPRSMISQVNV